MTIYLHLLPNLSILLLLFVYFFCFFLKLGLDWILDLHIKAMDIKTWKIEAENTVFIFSPLCTWWACHSKELKCQAKLLTDTVWFCQGTLAPNSQESRTAGDERGLILSQCERLEGPFDWLLPFSLLFLYYSSSFLHRRLVRSRCFWGVTWAVLEWEETLITVTLTDRGTGSLNESPCSSFWREVAVSVIGYVFNPRDYTGRLHTAQSVGAV